VGSQPNPGAMSVSIRRVAIIATMTALGIALAPIGAQADPAVNCTDNKPATGFSFTCDAALAVPPPGVAYPAPDGVSFSLGLPAPDAYSTLEITSFSVPGFHCSKVVGQSSDSLACSDTLMAGQTVSGTVNWKIGYHPRVPIGSCMTGQLDGYTAAPGPGGEYDRQTPSFALQVCQSSTPVTPAPQQLTAARAKSAAAGALLRRFGRSWRKGSSKQLTCSPLGPKFNCKVSWRYHAKRYMGRVLVSESSGVVRTRVQVH
jgi:hypothetical protein